MDIIIYLEAMAFVSLVVFSGVLNSKYYEVMPVQGLERGVVFLLTLALLAFMAQICHKQTFFIMAYVIWHLSMVRLLYVSWKEHLSLDFKYERQRMFARGFLISAIMFESVALFARIVQLSM